MTGESCLFLRSFRVSLSTRGSFRCTCVLPLPLEQTEGTEYISESRLPPLPFPSLSLLLLLLQSMETARDEWGGHNEEEKTDTRPGGWNPKQGPAYLPYHLIVWPPLRSKDKPPASTPFWLKGKYDRRGSLRAHGLLKNFLSHCFTDRECLQKHGEFLTAQKKKDIHRHRNPPHRGNSRSVVLF